MSRTPCRRRDSLSLVPPSMAEAFAWTLAEAAHWWSRWSWRAAVASVSGAVGHADGARQSSSPVQLQSLLAASVHWEMSVSWSSFRSL